MTEVINHTACDLTRLGNAPHLATDLPGPNAQAIIERDRRVASTSYTRDFPLVVKRALGCVVQDVDDNRFLDFAAGIAVCATGHCHPEVVKACTDQLNNLIHICGCDFYFQAMTELSEKLAQIAPGDQPKRVFLTNSGAEAVECAIKLARHATNRKWLIAFHGAFHGRTMGALSLTCSKVRQKQNFGPLVPMVAHAPYADLDAVRDIFNRQAAPEEVAAIFVEPIQGEGGYVFPPDNFLPELRALCDQHGILLVCDEIQSGMGRTGKWFACQHFNLVPDIITSAKGIASGMPLGAVIAPQNIMNWPPGAQGSTYGGNPVACAAALATLKLVESEYMQNAQQMGEKLRNRLSDIAAKHPLIADVRGLGLMTGVTVLDPNGKPSHDLRDDFTQRAFAKGLILLGCGDTALRFAPPLCITESELNTGLDIIEQTAAEMSN